METLELAKIAVKEIESLKKNNEVMSLVTSAALEKVASELNEEGYTCTSKAVDFMCIRHSNIAKRVEEYINAGLMGCLMAKYSNAA